MNPLPQFKRNLQSVSSFRISIPGAVYCIAWLVVSITLPGRIAVAQVQTVLVDFGGRSNATPPVPSGFFAVGGAGDSLIDRDGISTLTSAGLTGTRFWISLQEIYGTSMGFRYLDARLRRINASGLHPIAVIYDTPSSLGPSTCGPPSDISQWGEMAASVVAHVDQKFPGLLQDYEIWNEAELPTSLCISDYDTRLNTYVSMFAAAASAMHAQAKADGQTIRTGGPTIVELNIAPYWLPELLNNPSTAPYVDFVSFHLYISGQNDINDGMDWPQLYAFTQSSTRGVAYYYQMIESLVRAGQQPNPESTPIYITEFNTNWAFAVDCCRNHPTYGPLWNSLAITDFLNVVYTGATAVPSRVVYFNSAGNYFCLLGEWDADMDCNQSQMDPYPQYYAYQLFASPSYLNLQDGGHMAVSVSPASTALGLSATAFYTDGADNVVVVNPTSTSYDAVEVNLANPGLTLVAGTQYLLNADNAQISVQSATLTPISGGYSTALAVPAYSTVALSVAGTQMGASPTAVLNVTPQSGTHPLWVSIDSSQSLGGGSAIIGRTIDFGDGQWLSWRPSTWHKYTQPGSYTVSVAVRNESQQLTYTETTITVY